MQTRMVTAMLCSMSLETWLDMIVWLAQHRSDAGPDALCTLAVDGPAKASQILGFLCQI
jgi:hypothetical protein